MSSLTALESIDLSSNALTGLYHFHFELALPLFLSLSVIVHAHFQEHCHHRWELFLL